MKIKEKIMQEQRPGSSLEFAKTPSRLALKVRYDMMTRYSRILLITSYPMPAKTLI